MSQPDPHDGLVELTTLVRDCSVAGVSRRVLVVRIDLLPPKLSQPHHLRLAHEALEPLSGADRARRYMLARGRMAISWRGEAAGLFDQAIASLAVLMQDAPIEAPTLPELVRVFDLPKDGAALLAVATGPAPADTAFPAVPLATPTAANTTRLPAQPLDLPALELMEQRLASANVARFVRRRAVCRTDMQGALFSTAWETRFLSINELVTDLCPGRNAFAEPWLFRRLTRMLDRRMLSLLSLPAELRDAGPFGLDLNVGGILSPEFLKFDAALPSRLRGSTVLNLQPADVMGDLPAFRFASAFARGRGHKISLRGITPPLLPLLDLALLEPDFVELRWSPPLLGFDPDGLRAGSARWLLSRVDDPDAIRWGRAVGIGLFHGDAVKPGTALAAARAAA